MPLRLHELYYNLGHALHQQGNLLAAADSYRQAIVLQPNFALAHHALGVVLGAQEQFDEAIVAYRYAIQQQPDFVAAHYDLGRALQYQQQHLPAATCFERVSQLAPDFVAAYGDGAVSWMAAGNFVAAIECLRAAVAQQPIFIESYCEWAIDLTGQDQLTRARIACARFLRALQESAAVGETYGHLQQTYLHLSNVQAEYGGSKQAQQAEVYYQKALKLSSWVTSAQKVSLLVNLPMLPSANGTKLPNGSYASTWKWMQAAGLDRRYYVSLKKSYTEPSPAALSSNEISREDCNGLNCSPCLEKIFRAFQPRHLGEGAYACTTSAELPPSAPFVATIPQGRAWVVPQTNAWMVCNAIAVFTPDDYLLADLSRDYPGQLPGCRSYPSHRVFEQEDLPPLEQIQGTVAVLAGLSGHVYFHWMVDILPRFDLLRRAGLDLSQIDWFLLNSRCQPFQQETLEILGIPAAKTLSSDRHPHIQAQQLIAPAFAGHLGWLQPWALQFLRQTFLPDRSFHCPPRIYIQRDRASYRRILNEPDILELLAQAGFVPVVLESLSVRQQVALFANAQAIVALHGSGLTNLAFCRPQTLVIELVSPHYIRHYYWVISRYLQLQHYYLIGVGFGCALLRELMYQNPLMEDVLVNAQALKAMLKRLNLIG